MLSAGSVRQSVSVDLSSENLSGERADHRRAQAIWRLATQLGRGRFRADVDLLALRQRPNSPAPLDEATGQFSALLPVDFNQNPANAALDSDRYKVVLDYDLPLRIGRWGSTAAYTQTHTDSVRGFIDAGDTPQPWTAKTNADLESFQQALDLKEMFVDSHLTTGVGPRLDLTTGVNLLMGRAGADSLRYGQRLLLDGVSQVPSTESVTPKGTVDFNDRRRFVGVYAQSDYRLTSSASLLGGLRWNTTHETRDTVRVNSRGVATTVPATQDVNRLTGSLGAAWRVWQAANSPISVVTLHGSVGYLSASADRLWSDPEAQPEGGGLLTPNAAQRDRGSESRCAGRHCRIRCRRLLRRLLQSAGSSDVGGIAVLRSIGQQRYKHRCRRRAAPVEGYDDQRQRRLERRALRRLPDGYRWHSHAAGGQSSGVDAIGARWRRIAVAPARGWRGSFTANWIGEHWLNSTFNAPAYAVIDGSLGYRFARFTAAVLGSTAAGATMQLAQARRRTVLSPAGTPRGCDADLALQKGADRRRRPPSGTPVRRPSPADFRGFRTLSHRLHKAGEKPLADEILAVAGAGRHFGLRAVSKETGRAPSSSRTSRRRPGTSTPALDRRVQGPAHQSRTSRDVSRVSPAC